MDADRVISDILMGDTSGSQNWIFSGGPLILANDTGTKPQLRALSGAVSNYFNVEIRGAHGLRKEQANMVVLALSNSWTGDTEINRGSLRTLHANAIPSGPGRGNVIMQVVGGAPTLDLGNVSPQINALISTAVTATVTCHAFFTSGTSTLTLGNNDASGSFAGVIANSTGGRVVALTKVGTGTQTLTGVNTYSGATTVNGGMLLGRTGGSCANSAVSVGAAGTFGVQYAGGATKWTVASLTYSATGAKQYFDFGPNTPSATTAPLEVTGALTFTATPTVDVASDSLLYSGTYPLIKYGSLSGTMPTTANLLAGGTATLSNHPPSQTIYIIVVGYVGPTRHWATGDGDWDFATANWKLSDGSSAVFTNGAPVEFLDLDASGNPIVTVTDTVEPASVTVDSTKHYTLTGTGTIAGSTRLTKAGTGTLTLDLANTYTGGTTNFAGRLNINNAAALGSTAGTFNIAGGTIDNTSGSALTLNNYPQVWSGDFSFAGSQDLHLGDGAVTLTAARAVTVSGATLTVGGTISGSGFGLTKSGAGTLVLNGVLGTGAGNLTVNAGTVRLNAANTFSGATRVISGTLVVGHSSALQNSTFNLAAGDTGVLEFASGVTAATLGGLTGGDAARTIVLTNAANLPVALSAGNNNANTTFIGKLLGGTFTKVGTGTLQSGATGAGDATAFQLEGDFTINNGRVTLHATAGGGLNAVQGLIVVNSPGVLDLAHRPSLGPIRGLSGNGTVDKSIVGAGATATITVGRDNASATFSGLIKETTGTTVVALTKTGTGTQTLSGANTYTGGTTISNGVLKVSNTSGSATGPGPVVIIAAGTLMGSGSVSGAVTVNGTIAPGDGVGTLSTGSQTWNPGGKYNWEVNQVGGTPGTDWDHLNVTGNINVQATPGSPFTIKVLPPGGDITGFDMDTTTNWLIATASGSVLNFAANKFSVDDSAVTDDLGGGSFVVDATATTLRLRFTNNHAPVALATNYVRAKHTALKIPIAALLAGATSDPDGHGRVLHHLRTGA
ncbi:MAG: autotransporter-associated beta strand repeat-containing protein, partial [Verrucomicrobiales bacterium]|nr:autotransporter-associated beta strand repeat-containing protein [Verrucomicrobiales bacterium]